MTIKERIVKKIEHVPKKQLKTVLHFICGLEQESLKEKKTSLPPITKRLVSKKRQLLLISESSLAKDWLTPEEDKAWENL